jgi:hypothetical protein
MEKRTVKLDDGHVVDEFCECDKDWCNCDPVSGAGLIEATRSSFFVAALGSFVTNRLVFYATHWIGLNGNGVVVED